MSCKHGNSDFSFDPCELCSEETEQIKIAYKAGRKSVFDELREKGTIVEASQAEELAALRAENAELRKELGAYKVLGFIDGAYGTHIHGVQFHAGMKPVYTKDAAIDAARKGKGDEQIV